MLRGCFVILLTLTSEKFINLSRNNRIYNEAGFEVSAKDSAAVAFFDFWTEELTNLFALDPARR